MKTTSLHFANKYYFFYPVAQVEYLARYVPTKATAPWGRNPDSPIPP